ncbi:XRE family transcriptional regulator [Streptomyces sp. Ag109_G2-15]|uniref:XRE family transcriptional regulator n=1 Tax=Streptomyces sp. Ag109_G2-15 TaxID=1938850 RepID=UPI000BD6277D|nr:XRE family transcriptional regulator [Streptomyces sp. Ag109_G2-15]SOE06776.1 NB-ARC domain-containing protein [Streptomyces sp. Ag109_G2-15]
MTGRTAEGDPQEELAARLRLLQELSGLGVRALARDTGLSSSSLSRYLNGQTLPPWPAVVALCRLVKRDPRPLRPLWERTSNPLPAPPKSSRQVRPLPRNDLPRDAPDFTGRDAQLAAVLAAVDSHRAVSVDGMAGVGKTCLAVHAAHRLAADFPDAQLYVDLHGFTEGREPMDPDSVLRMLFAALDVPSERVPREGVEQLAACWRSELARRRVVVVLDNAADADQVRPLLPGAGESVALVTSRNRLLGLDEVPPVSLDVLSPRESAELLARASGDPDGPDGRLTREPESAAEVLRLCGHLPLALRLAGARLRHRPGWTVGILVERMAEGASEFDAEFSAAFAMSVRQLNRPQARLFRMLGLLPGASFDEYVVAALAEVPLRSALATLEDLVDAHLVQQPTAGRYRLHDLVHQHARRATAEQDPAAERERALGRILDYYVHAAAAADAAMPFLSPAVRPRRAGRRPSCPGSRTRTRPSPGSSRSTETSSRPSRRRPPSGPTRTCANCRASCGRTSPGAAARRISTSSSSGHWPPPSAWAIRRNWPRHTATWASRATTRAGRRRPPPRTRPPNSGCPRPRTRRWKPNWPCAAAI